MKLLLATVGLALLSFTCAAARLEANEFDAQGLELLAGRYGTAYPGYPSTVGQFGSVGGKVDLNQQMLMPQQQQPLMPQQFGQFGGDDGDDLDLGDSPLGNVGQQMPWQQPIIPRQRFASVGSGLDVNLLSVGAGASSMLYGGVGLGSGHSKKGQTTVAAPIYAESMIVPKIITQPILRPHMVTQPIVQQQLIQQPIVETRQVIQPVIRRIITQPIIRPQIYESTTVQPTLKTETTVQPHLIQQTVVTPQLQNVAMENQPIQEAAVTQKAQPVVQAPISAKKSHTGGQTQLGLGTF